MENWSEKLNDRLVIEYKNYYNHQYNNPGKSEKNMVVIKFLEFLNDIKKTLFLALLTFFFLVILYMDFKNIEVFSTLNEEFYSMLIATFLSTLSIWYITTLSEKKKRENKDISDLLELIFKIYEYNHEIKTKLEYMNEREEFNNYTLEQKVNWYWDTEEQVNILFYISKLKYYTGLYLKKTITFELSGSKHPITYYVNEIHKIQSISNSYSKNNLLTEEYMNEIQEQEELISKIIFILRIKKI